MLNRPSTSTIFVVSVILIVIVAPFIIFMWPLFQLITFRFDSQNLLMVAPVKNYYLLGVGFISLIIGLSLLAYKRMMVTYFLFTCSILTAAGFMYYASLSYIQIHPDFVQVKDFHDINTYPIQDMEQVYYDYGIEEKGRYLFYTQDGDVIEVADSPLLDGEKRNKLHSIIKAHGIELTHRVYDDL